ncbi:valine--tRNA ligase [candidate division CPR3 bacterium 4484_211]|uniref:Valine--tRNA ligase n=1 Tax=candidate division CPR3 bacterium 4484_211 TaxID=1968527 RepID=A0A1W9NXT1_UNCC3|nr:MAG: valine--tRNA ligase [candidate division CPR3 bacterium 4484_211]
MLGKRPNFSEYEPKIYQFWEEKGYFKPEINPDGKPFCILLPPPNANADLHVGHAMYVVEDLLIRWHRMLGDNTLWTPGTDHAGFETQYVYEKKLSSSGQSRFNFDRETLYQKIFEFVKENSGIIQKQLRRLGFSLDWSRETFTLDPKVINLVYKTFKKMHQDGLIYRDNYIVNYCPHFGTTFADLEVKYLEKQAKLWFIKYPLKARESKIKDKWITVATTRPETMLGDTAVAVHPDDERYKNLVGQTALLPLTNREIPIIADEAVDPEFGTGAVKVTPAHDPTDFEIAKRHNLPLIQVVDFSGKLSEKTGSYKGLPVLEARKKIVRDLAKQDLIEKIDKNYTHRVLVSYKGNYPIEPMVMPNWFVKTNEKFKIRSKKLKKLSNQDEISLGEMGLLAVKKGLIKIIPKRFEKQYYQWMENIKPWPISRQIVWGIRIPAWYNVMKYPALQVAFLNSKNGQVVSGEIGKLLNTYSLSEIEKGLQSLIAPTSAEYIISPDKPGENFLPETDVFDTWFSSGQWPLATLNYPNGEDFKTFYPTSVLDTMWDILFFWVARMVMLGLYLTDDVPFKTVYLHSMVTDKKGAKMSKSKGNVINPLEVVEKYGADALRMSLLVGSAPGNPVSLSMEKVKGYRNFVTKIWNASRFVLQHKTKLKTTFKNPKLETADKKILNRLDQVIRETTAALEKFHFSSAGETIYDFFWHEFCDRYIEQTKKRLYGEDERAKCQALSVLLKVLIDCLKLLHPFMPFVTEEIYQKFLQAGLKGPEYKEALMVSPWPRTR